MLGIAFFPSLFFTKDNKQVILLCLQYGLISITKLLNLLFCELFLEEMYWHFVNIIAYDVCCIALEIYVDRIL